MRILYDHQVFSRQQAGGASRYFFELIRSLSGHPDVRVEVLMGIQASVYPFQELSAENIRVTSFAGPKLPGIGLYAGNEVLSNALTPFRGRWDVYHSTLYRRMPLVWARGLVATHHDCTQERYPQEFKYASKVRRAKKALYAQADAIICVSEWCRKELLDFYPVNPAKTRVIYHGLTRLPRSPQAAVQLREYARREYLLYVGSRATYKNFSGLLTAFRETGVHEQFDLLVLGGSPLTATEGELIAKLGLASVVSAPLVSDELLAEAYAGAKLFVYPSFSEGFGFPPLEAMSAGCPVLASNCSCIPEICHDAPFYFDPQDQSSFNRELLRALNDEEARQRSVQLGWEVAAQYDWKRCGEETLALYHDLQ